MGSRQYVFQRDLCRFYVFVLEMIEIFEQRGTLSVYGSIDVGTSVDPFLGNPAQTRFWEFEQSLQCSISGNGMISSGGEFVAGKRGYGYTTNGSDGYLYTRDHGVVDITNFIVTVWVSEILPDDDGAILRLQGSESLWIRCVTDGEIRVSCATGYGAETVLYEGPVPKTKNVQITIMSMVLENMHVLLIYFDDRIVAYGVNVWPIGGTFTYLKLLEKIGYTQVVDQLRIFDAPASFPPAASFAFDARIETEFLQRCGIDNFNVLACIQRAQISMGISGSFQQNVSFAPFFRNGTFTQKIGTGMTAQSRIIIRSRYDD